MVLIFLLDMDKFPCLCKELNIINWKGLVNSCAHAYI